ncbi:MAG TPA: enoyl-CoA hydratase/isomerase family protein [Acidimicrobiales bacterium]|nr:enoyl-CoA hydratase/isomerase family protein [Acidimicrobiales bacterium]
MEEAPYRVGSEDRGAVRLLTLDRPAKLNALTAAGFDSLRGRLEEAATDPEVAVCVLTGSGRAFCSGVDLSAMDGGSGTAGLRSSFDPLLATLAHFEKPLVAAVNGLAVGFGATVLLHCDLVVVDETAQIRLPFVALGTTAEAAATWLLPRRVGMQRAAWAVLGGQPLSADEAVAAGLALATAPAGHAVEGALERAQVLAGHGVAPLVANKRLLRYGWAEQIVDAWQREAEAMVTLAREVGTFGRSWSGREGDRRPT